MLTRLQLLKQITFGEQVAEDEANVLANYFVETNDWARISRGEIDIVRGEKGAGKSAIYSLLLNRSGEFFDRNVMLIAAENPRGATVFRDLSAEPPTTEREFIALWKLYTLALIAREARAYDLRGQDLDIVYRALESAHLLERDSTLAGLLRGIQEYVRRLIHLEALEGGVQFDPATQMVSGLSGRIILSEPGVSLRNTPVVSVDKLLSVMDAALRSRGWNVWVLFDRLDVAFVENHELETNALRALIRTYLDFKAYTQISLKVFLREDIWTRLVEGGFREHSHVVKYVVLNWDDESLLNLIMRRLLNNKTIADEFGIDVHAILADYDKQVELFYRFFPDQVEQGPQKAKTFKWLIGRCADGTKKTAPRELIHLSNSIRDTEIRRLERGDTPTEGMQLFDRSVFKAALPIVSKTRLTSYLYAEYPSERPVIAKLEGQKTEQTPESLAALWQMTNDEATAKARQLKSLGFFEERGTREQPTFWIPFLYRDALSLVQGKADD